MTELTMSSENKLKLRGNKIQESLVKNLQLMFLTWHEPNSSKIQVGSVKYPVEVTFTQNNTL
jgi:hypothetical protein